MLRYILAVLLILACFAQPAAAQDNQIFIKNYSKMRSPSGEQINLIRLSKTMIAPHTVRYVALDQQGRIVSHSPDLDYAHSIGCSNIYGCVFYDLWHIMPGKNAAWHMKYNLAPAQRQSLIPAHADDAQKKQLEDLMAFIASDSKNIFETTLFQNMPAANLPNIYGTVVTVTKAPISDAAIFLMLTCLFSVILFHQNIYDRKAFGFRQSSFGGGGFQVYKIMMHVCVFAFSLVVMFRIPGWYFFLILAVYAAGLYLAYQIASRRAARKLAALAQATNKETVNPSSAQ